MKEKRTVQSVKRQVAAFFRESRRMPTYEEMVALLGVKSKSVVHFWVGKLIEAEILERDSKGRLAWKQRPFSIPLVGEVAAGFPSPEEEELRDILSLDEYLVARPEASFLLQVSGDSMTGEGIMPGDLVIVEKGREPKNGDVVIAQVDDKWTMKTFRKEKGEVYLEAANPNYPLIRPRQELKLAGVVTAVVRKYHT
ncbi:MAG: transcriptional repressor LexA [Syntrophus sp. (in: bacteria)]|nr:transcriptional repressor LexA [Syntrophus sp. (in: bacteria)]